MRIIRNILKRFLGIFGLTTSTGSAIQPTKKQTGNTNTRDSSTDLSFQKQAEIKTVKVNKINLAP